MKITHVDPVLVETPESPVLVETPEPAPVPPAPALVETPEAIAERQAADSAALEGTRRLVAELQARLSTVEAEHAEHRQSAEQPFTGQPDELAGWLAITERHRAEAAKLDTEAESLRRQCAVARELLARLERERDDAESARTQAAGRKMLARALERYTGAVVALADVVVEVGGAAILANQPSSFVAAMRYLCIPDLATFGKITPDLAGFTKRREGQVVNQGDAAYQRRANELLKNFDPSI